MAEAIQDVALWETTQERYLNYALSVITSRALPDVRDGLKPVQRRILYAMFHNLHLSPDGRHRKSAAVVGEVMAKYHPHGDQSIYDAMVRMAQDFALRYPLVDGQGNFGSLDGDGAAAMRYTEARLRHLAVELLDELGKETVGTRPNYDGTLEEPVVLPAQVPNLLVNGSTGIAVGMATNVPPHNLGEVVDALVALIDEPGLGLEEILASHIRGPDFPTGGRVLNTREDLLEIYREGRGAFVMEGTWHAEQEGRRRQVIVDSIPYALNKSALIAEIADHIRQGKVPQIVDIRDESTEDIRVVLELRRDADPETAMAYLLRRTGLRGRFNLNLTALFPADGEHDDAALQPRRLDLVSVLRAFLSFRRTVTQRRLEYDLRQLERRIHLLRGFAILFDALDEAIALIRTSSDKPEARTALMKRFGLDHEQAEAVLETRLYRLARMEIEAIRAELREKEAAAAEILTILGSETRLWQLIREELLDLRAAYGDARRTEIARPVPLPEFNAEAYILAEDTFLMVTRAGRFKRQKSYTDLSAVRVPEGDELGWVVPGSTRATAVFFSDRGRAYTLRLADVPATTGYGDPLQARFDFADGEYVVGVVVTDPRVLPEVSEEMRLAARETGDPDPPYCVAMTRGGRTLRFAVDGFREPSTVAGRSYLRLDRKRPDDAVVHTTLCAGDENISLITRQSRCLIFPVSEVKVLAGPGKGVLAIKIPKDDHVMGFTLARRPGEGLTAETNRGRVEVIRASRYKVGRRAGRGRELVRRGFIERVHREVLVLAFPEEEPDQPPPADAAAAPNSTPNSDSAPDSASDSASDSAPDPDPNSGTPQGFLF